jgi:hypothetical protein
VAIILQEFNTLFLTGFRTYSTKFLHHPQTKVGEEGVSDRYTPAAKALYRSFYWITTFGIAFYHCNLSTRQFVKRRIRIDWGKDGGGGGAPSGRPLWGGVNWGGGGECNPESESVEPYMI